tara:strand:- start:14 stop:2065 length:2052 start_codon:yes stop_codon:yes gene_type:complete
MWKFGVSAGCVWGVLIVIILAFLYLGRYGYHRLKCKGHYIKYKNEGEEEWSYGYVIKEGKDDEKTILCCDELGNTLTNTTVYVQWGNIGSHGGRVDEITIATTREIYEDESDWDWHMRLGVGFLDDPEYFCKKYKGDFNKLYLILKYIKVDIQRVPRLVDIMNNHNIDLTGFDFCVEWYLLQLRGNWYDDTGPEATEIDHHKALLKQKIKDRDFSIDSGGFIRNPVERLTLECDRSGDDYINYLGLFKDYKENDYVKIRNINNILIVDPRKASTGDLDRKHIRLGHYDIGPDHRTPRPSWYDYGYIVGGVYTVAGQGTFFKIILTRHKTRDPFHLVRNSGKVPPSIEFFKTKKYMEPGRPDLGYSRKHFADLSPVEKSQCVYCFPQDLKLIESASGETDHVGRDLCTPKGEEASINLKIESLNRDVTKLSGLLAEQTILLEKSKSNESFVKRLGGSVHPGTAAEEQGSGKTKAQGRWQQAVRGVGMETHFVHGIQKTIKEKKEKQMSVTDKIVTVVQKIEERIKKNGAKIMELEASKGLVDLKGTAEEDKLNEITNTQKDATALTVSGTELESGVLPGEPPLQEVNPPGMLGSHPPQLRGPGGEFDQLGQGVEELQGVGEDDLAMVDVSAKDLEGLGASDVEAPVGKTITELMDYRPDSPSTKQTVTDFFKTGKFRAWNPASP